MKEGSEDPVLTATAPGIEVMSSPSGNSTSSTTPNPYINPTTSPNVSRKPSISASSEAGSSAPYEVIYTEKTTENDGSEDLITLHYAFDDANSTLFDEVEATESLLMLSEGRDNIKTHGKLNFIVCVFTNV